MSPTLNAANTERSGLPTLESTHLFSLGREVRIRHGGEEYRLRLTSNNKLILTK